MKRKKKVTFKDVYEELMKLKETEEKKNTQPVPSIGQLPCIPCCCHCCHCCHCHQYPVYPTPYVTWSYATGSSSGTVALGAGGTC